jgi:hypothetical protein
MYKGGWIAKRDGKRLGTTMPTDQHAKDLLDSTRKSLGRKTIDILKRKKQEIAHGLGRFSMATEEAYPKQKLASLRAAGKHVEARGIERTLLAKGMAKENPPFTPDKPNSNPGIVVGRNKPQVSRVRHLARLGLKKAMEQNK